MVTCLHDCYILLARVGACYIKGWKGANKLQRGSTWCLTTLDRRHHYFRESTNIFSLRDYEESWWSAHVKFFSSRRESSRQGRAKWALLRMAWWAIEWFAHLAAGEEDQALNAACRFLRSRTYVERPCPYLQPKVVFFFPVKEKISCIIVRVTYVFSQLVIKRQVTSKWDLLAGCSFQTGCFFPLLLLKLHFGFKILSPC
jgi:hypothetical protein